MALNKGRRNTVQRQVMLEELQKLSFHPTAAELYKITRMRLPRLSLGTVYRNLEILVTMDLVRKLEIAGREARFDGNIDPHNHVRCVRCGAIEDIHGLPADPVSDEIAQKTSYTIFAQRLELLGNCPDCAKKGDDLEN